MPQALAGTGGFLCAVLWMDLMFDVQIWNHAGTAPEATLASIAAYYHRVTTTADPMGNVVSLVMLLTLLGAAVQLSLTRLSLWMRGASLVLALGPIIAALTVIVPAAVRLGGRGDAPQVQSELAHTILTGHLWCLAAMLAFVALQIVVVACLKRAA